MRNNKETNKKNSNREIILITYIFIGLFVLLVGNFAIFILKDSKTAINSSYNKRQNLLAQRVVRGSIMGNNNEILAETKTDKSGNEVRVYPYGNVFAHIVGRVDQGKTGIEEMENFTMLASNDNPFVKIGNELSGDKNIGDNVITTLDVKLQKTAYDALGNKKGAVVALDPGTGKILAMVSKPDYDPNYVSKNWETLNKDEENGSPLLNRVTQGLYPPGSTFKILTALEYIRENKQYNKYIYDCIGKNTFNQVEINCYKNKHHGEEDLKESFAKSCNTSFANIGTSLNMDSFRKLCESFLFNKELPTNIPYKYSSFVLNSKSAKEEIPQTAIGQGKTLISPFHNALIVSAIANGGVLMNPYVVDHVENCKGDVVSKKLPSIYGTLLSAKEAEILGEMMESVVNNGTASSLKGLSYSAAGKTGSAEFDSSKDSHSWFVGYAPVDNPKIVVSIIVEGAGTGSEYAVPIAKKIFDQYLK